jgi:sugar-specific transcriptional regulator TrmB
MSSTVDIEIELKQIGLSSNEVKVYLLLIKSGQSSVQAITTQTSIPRSTVYETLKSLLEKGLIEEVIEHKKKDYKAYPLNVLKHKLIEEHTKIEENIKHIDQLENTIGSLGIQSMNDIQIRKYTGKSGARQLFWNTLDAKDMVYVYSFFGRQQYVGAEFYQSFVSESKIRQIKERVIINPSERASFLIKRDYKSPRARTDPKDIRIIDPSKIDIKGETFIYNNVFATVYLDQENIVGFEIESDSFADTHRSIFNVHWELAKQLVL